MVRSNCIPYESQPRLRSCSLIICNDKHIVRYYTSRAMEVCLYENGTFDQQNNAIFLSVCLLKILNKQHNQYLTCQRSWLDDTRHLKKGADCECVSSCRKRCLLGWSTLSPIFCCQWLEKLLNLSSILCHHHIESVQHGGIRWLGDLLF